MSKWSDGFSRESPAKCAELVTAVTDCMALLNISGAQKTALAKMKQGMPLAGILGIDRHHRDALLVRGHQLFKAGQLKKAGELFYFLHILQPVDSRVIYALAVTLQATDVMEDAARLFLLFIALDATNPDGHLRLAECLLSLHEPSEAEQHLRVARRLAATTEQKDYADRLLAHVAERSSSAAPKAADSRAASLS